MLDVAMHACSAVSNNRAGLASTVEEVTAAAWQEKPSSSSKPSAPVENPDNAETQVWTDLTPAGGDLKAGTTAALLDGDKKKGEQAEEEQLTDDELVENVEGHEDPFVAAECDSGSEQRVSEDEGVDGTPLEDEEEEEEKENDQEQDDDPDVANDTAGQKMLDGGAHKDPAFQFQYVILGNSVWVGTVDESAQEGSPVPNVAQWLTRWRLDLGSLG